MRKEIVVLKSDKHPKDRISVPSALIDSLDHVSELRETVLNSWFSVYLSEFEPDMEFNVECECKFQVTIRGLVSHYTVTALPVINVTSEEIE